MKKLLYGLLSCALCIPVISPAASKDAATLGKAKNMQDAISACLGKQVGDNCFTTPFTNGKYAAMVAMVGACSLGKVDFEKDGIQASVLSCQPKPMQSTGSKNDLKVLTPTTAVKVVTSDTTGQTVAANPPAETLTNK